MGKVNPNRACAHTARLNRARTRACFPTPAMIRYPYHTADAPSNMAIDEWIAQRAAATNRWHLRLYGWTEPAFTFGYSQAYDEVAAQATAARTRARTPALVRRITGGGIVDHRNDLTYALAIPSASPLHRASAARVYTDLHTWLAQALAAQGIAADLAPCPRAACANASASSSSAAPAPPPAPARVNTLCFAQPEPSDLVDASMRKIAGAAMKRSAGFLLIQGSIDRARLPATFDDHAFADALTALIVRQSATPIESGKLPPAEDPALLQLRARYADPHWNMRR